MCTAAKLWTSKMSAWSSVIFCTCFNQSVWCIPSTCGVLLNHKNKPNCSHIYMPLPLLGYTIHINHKRKQLHPKTVGTWLLLNLSFQLVMCPTAALAQDATVNWKCAMPLWTGSVSDYWVLITCDNAIPLFKWLQSGLNAKHQTTKKHSKCNH